MLVKDTLYLHDRRDQIYCCYLFIFATASSVGFSEFSEFSGFNFKSSVHYCCSQFFFRDFRVSEAAQSFRRAPSEPRKSRRSWPYEIEVPSSKSGNAKHKRPSPAQTVMT